MSPPYDQRLANEALAAEQCMKLGAVLLDGSKRNTGFAPRPSPPASPPKPPLWVDDVD